MNKIIDCFTFYNELKMLSFRLKELNNVVDHFVLVEATLTHSGQPKELIYQNNKHLFEEYNHKIVHVVVDDMPTDTSHMAQAWDREHHQRDCIVRGVEQLDVKDTDIILVSDCDEIPDPELLNQIKHNGFNIFKQDSNNKFLFQANHNNKETYNNELFGLKQDHYYYNIHCKCAEKNVWYFSRILTYKKLLEIGGPQKVRMYDVGTSFYSNAGWHFSYFGGVDRIIKKIESFCHQDLNQEQFKDKETITKLIKDCKDLYFGEGKYNKTLPQDNDYLPKNYEILL